MKLINRLAVMFSLTLLIACGGGGGSTAGTGGNERVATPIETRTIGSETITIGGDNGLPALSGLTSFTPSITSSTMQTFRDFWNGGEPYIGNNPDGLSRIGGATSGMGRIGVCCWLPGLTNSALPGDPAGHTHYDKHYRDPVTYSTRVADLSLIHPRAVSHNAQNDPTSTPQDYFVDSSYRSRTSSTATIGNVSFARGSLTATRRHDNTPLEFQTFAGWLDGGFFSITQVSIGESGREQYRLFSQYHNHAGWCCSIGPIPSGTGRAVWEGAAVASIKDAAAIEDDWAFIRGGATIDIDDLANPEVDLRFDNWHLINGREVSLPAVTFDGVKFQGANSNSYDETCYPYCAGNVTAGYFQSDSTESLKRVNGVFHGDNQEGVGGTFETEMLMGAFGAVRQ